MSWVQYRLIKLNLSRWHSGHSVAPLHAERKSNFAFSSNSFLASSETFAPIMKSSESSGERVHGTKIGVTPSSTSYLLKQKGRRSQVRHIFIGWPYKDYWSHSTLYLTCSTAKACEHMRSVLCLTPMCSWMAWSHSRVIIWWSDNALFFSCLSILNSFS